MGQFTVQEFVVALSEPIKMMKQTDEVIDAHGGWRNAFIKGDS